VTDLSGDLSSYAVAKTQFLDLVGALNAAGIDSCLIPSKIEGIAFGQDVVINGAAKHTLFVANDNDFLGTIADPFKAPNDSTRGLVGNPNQFYVFSFGDEDLPDYMPKNITPIPIHAHAHTHPCL
jgi:hypothetical protein